jgi:hypothetical protein
MVSAASDDVAEFELWEVDGLEDGVVGAGFKVAGAVGVDEFDDRVLWVKGCRR